MKIIDKILYDVSENDLKLLGACPEKFWKGVKIISSHAFYNLTSLKTISLPSTIVEIRDRAFENCQNLEYVSIPSSVEILGRNIFAGCNKIKNININLSEKLLKRSLTEKLGNFTITISKKAAASCQEKVFYPTTSHPHKPYAYDDSRDFYEQNPDFNGHNNDLSF